MKHPFIMKILTYKSAWTPNCCCIQFLVVFFMPVPTQTSSPVAALHKMAVTCARHRGIVRFSCGMYRQVCFVPGEESSSAKATMAASAPVLSPLMVLSVFLKTNISFLFVFFKYFFNIVYIQLYINIGPSVECQNAQY